MSLSQSQIFEIALMPTHGGRYDIMSLEPTQDERHEYAELKEIVTNLNDGIVPTLEIAWGSKVELGHSLVDQYIVLRHRMMAYGLE